MYQDIKNDLLKMLGTQQLRTEEPMKFHTTFRIGGNAQYYAMPETEEQLKELVVYCKEKAVPFYVIGNGSNLLVGDLGVEGVIIEIKESFSSIQFESDKEGATVTAGAGVLLSKLANKVAEKSLTGFEFAAGIPGTLGGAVAMNAGAYGGEIKDHIVWAKILTRSGEIKVVQKEDLQLGYRRSIITGTGDIVLEAQFHFPFGKLDEIKQTVKELNGKRREKQPLEFPSAGSTFKRPEGHFAGKLIMDAGLRGFRVGDAMVSEKHCGFVINAGDATAKDVKELMEQVSLIVKEKFGVTLEPEVRMIGKF